MPRPYARLRETTFDLYVERDLLPGYYRLIATVASWLVLAGYILFAIIFTSPDQDLNATRNLVTAVAGALLVIGYGAVLGVAVFSKSLLFMIDCVISPVLTVSLLGLFATIANWILHTRPPIAQAYLSIPLVTAIITTVVAAAMLLIAYRELRKIRRRDERRRWHIQMGPYVGVQPDPHAMIIPSEDEAAQRRQLMRLLHDRHESIANQEDVNNTFKIDLPDSLQRDNQARQTQANSNTFHVKNLLPWTKAASPKFKDAREMRREEIERSSISNLNEAWRASDTNQNPAWGWPPATRYA